MPLFDILIYSKAKRFPVKEVKAWLQLYLRKTHVDKLDLPPEQIVEIEKALVDAAKVNFSLIPLPNKTKALKFLDFQLKKTDKKIQSLKYLIASSSIKADQNIETNKKIDSLNETIFELMKSNKADHQSELNQLNLKKSLLLIDQNKLETNNIDIQEKEIELIKSKKLFESLFKQKSELIELIPIIANNKNESKRNHKSEKLEIKSENSRHSQKDVQHPTMSIPWDHIIFGEGYLYFSRIKSTSKKKGGRKGQYFQRFPMLKSRLSFNKVRELYINSNLPPIKIEYNGNTVVNIKNIEVVFYFFLFLENTGNDFTIKRVPDIIKEYSHFTKSFYKQHLSDLFLPRCFSYLIDKTSENTPIIPIPEKVVHSSGQESIHDSFLFPFKVNSSYLWIWESVEESKATYVFETSLDNYNEEIQRIYDFLTGDFENKRLSIIQNKIKRSDVPLIKRIKHADYEQWKRRIDQITD